MNLPERFRLGQLAPFLAGADDDLEALASRLPGGLVHAERVWITPEPPAWLTPLSSGSQWFGLGRELVVVAADADAAEARLGDLLGYHRVAAAVHGALDPDGLAAGDPRADLGLAEHLGWAPDRAAGLDHSAPGLRADLVEMARAGFDPEVRLHPALRPEAQRAAGVALASAIDARIPAGRYFLLVSDSAAPLELLSPYAADLGHSLYAWGLENPQALPEAGLADALRATEGEPDRDLASVVAQRLMVTGGDAIRTERRAAEATQGLHLDDAHGAVWGIADLARLEAPDARALPPEPYGVLAVVCAGSGALREAVCAALADTGRLEGVALVSDTLVQAAEPLVPGALIWPEDGVSIDASSAVGRLAERAEMPARVTGPTELGAGDQAWIGRALGALRRAVLQGRLDAEVRRIVTLAPFVSGAPLEGACRRLEAARLALAALLVEQLPAPKRAAKPTSPKKHSQISRRFRA